ncbi:hypothetical protein [Streptomyces sp. 769]|uniref:hypothetical protein n=1 Tax=Streptomyces sp. 769 TaxID=1262452 RepID=UPI00068E66C3|nr:hypothetical protein [Streptomyces sp. 769]
MWQRPWITSNRISAAQLRGVDLAHIVVEVDPPGGVSTVGDETSIVAVTRDRDGYLYIFNDRSGNYGAVA